MRLLVLGGTSFLGRTVVELAMVRDHAVTTFNRGLTGGDVQGGPALRGDRRRPADLRRLLGCGFDVLVDSGTLAPRDTARSAWMLAPEVPFAVFVSSAGVYVDALRLGADETSPTCGGSPDEDGDPADLSRIERFKRGGELATLAAFGPASTLIVRPSFLTGPHDNIGHLPRWLLRVAGGGRVLAPGRPGRRLQILDVRDLAAFILDCAEARRPGIFNGVPDGANTTMGELLETCVEVTGAAVELVWADDDFLLGEGVPPGPELGWWWPERPEYAGITAVSGAAAAAAGLRCRPFTRTVRETWDWVSRGGRVRPMPGWSFSYPKHDRARPLLEAWDHRGA